MNVQASVTMLLAVIVFAHASFAAIIGPSVEVGGLMQSCLIETIDPDSNQIQTVCSSVLTSPTEITSAAHCVVIPRYYSPKIQFRARCGYDSVTGNFHETHAFKQIKRSIGFNVRGDNTFDLAVFTLETASSIIPMQQVLEKEFQNFMVNASECRIEGFGRDETLQTGRLNHGTLASQDIRLEVNGIFHEQNIVEVFDAERRALLEQKTRESRGDEISRVKALMKINATGKLTNVTMNGDSGGGLFCRQGSDEWRLVGIASMGSFTTEDTDESTTLVYEQRWSPIITTGFVSETVSSSKD